MLYTTKIAAGVMLAAAASTALTGCGKKSTTTPSASMMPSTSTSAKTSTMPSATGMSTAKAGEVIGTINGQSKHLKAGELCQSKYASQYTQYGFTCAPKTSGSTKYYLTKN